MIQLNTPSRSSSPRSVTGRPATGAGRAIEAGPTAMLALLRSVDLLQLPGGRRDDVLGRVAATGLGEHVDDDVLRHALRGLVALRPRPRRQPRRLDRLL